MANNKTHHKKNVPWMAILALVIALIGGVPGIFNVIDYFNRIEVKIVFDYENSTVCLIDSKNKDFENKFCVLLYRISVVGKGNHPSYIKDIRIAINYKGEWVEGKRFFPTQRKQTDKNGITKKCIQLNLINKEPVVIGFLADWKDFKPQVKGLESGEPNTFSYAAMFDIKENYEDCSKLKITITDYLENEYKQYVDIKRYLQRTANRRLIQD